MQWTNYWDVRTLVYVDEGNTKTLIKNYIEKEQPNTIVDLNQKILPYDNEKQNGVLVNIDATKFTQQDYIFLNQLPAIIQDSGQIGDFELGNLKISIINMQEYVVY